MGQEKECQGFFTRVDRLDEVIEDLLDLFPDIVFSIKDRSGRYVAVSKGFIDRVGAREKDSLLGRTAHDLFPRVMADRYTRQDEQVFQGGRAVTDNLDITLYRDGSFGYCLTSKLPVRDRQGEVIGLACISKDIGSASEHDWVSESFAVAVDHILDNYGKSMSVKELASMAHLTVAQFDRRFKRVFGMTAGPFILKVKLDAAARLIRTTRRSLATIAVECGFCDQSALTRRFKAAIGCTPGEYRKAYQVSE